MALIKCIECGKKISDSEEKCPNCGKELSLEDKQKGFCLMRKSKRSR